MHAILVHGYLGFPENNWFPWLRRELEAKGWTTEALKLPFPALPQRKHWTPVILDALGKADPSNTVLIGHSLGCVATLYALEELRPSVPFAAGVLCAGFGRDYHDADRLVHWFQPPPDLTTIKKYAKKWTEIHSTDDPLVPYAEGEWLAKQLDAKFVTLKGKGHLMRVPDRVVELPEALAAALAA